jgi:RimJ/RimL family protein N-acetyltransferase
MKGRGIAKQASKLILEYGFISIGLNRIYLFTETENIGAQKLFERVGFVKEGCLKQDLVSHGKFVDRYAYGICKEDYDK